MLIKRDSLKIPIRCQYGDAYLYIVPTDPDKDLIYEVDTPYPGETAYHLVESSNYQYEFESEEGRNYQLSNNIEVDRSDIISRSNLPNRKNQGTIKTNLYVGQLSLAVSDLSTGAEVGKVNLEIRSVKADYESDYRTMLDEIAEYYTELVLLQSSPVTQRLEVDDNCNSQTLYQKFSFVRSIIDSDSFQEAIHKIVSNPVRKWTDTTVERDIYAVKRLSRRNIRQIVTSSDRIPLNSSNNHSYQSQLTSIPRKLDVDYKRDTIDNHENQFVKFALRTFSMFCSDLRCKKNASERLKGEIDRTLNQISTYLDTKFFRQISMPTHLNMNSPVLQRKEGYREVLQAWLMLDLAAKLNWTGGNNVYNAGKKNVAVLYEYWLFFKLQELISEFFQINHADKNDLVKIDGDNIDLNIIQGKKVILRGKNKTSTRVLNIAFYYNRTFSKVKENNDPIHKAGSWTMSMRPDYTLSIWPGEITEEQAEAEDLITHIHFDAKYRLNKVLLEDDTDTPSDDDMNSDKALQEMGIYKRADLLKMHAYKDAIRRTSGAYVLYPGTENREIKGFHEIIPGLGAFSIRPGHWRNDSIHLKTFLAEVKAHMLDRASQREKLSYHHYDIYREKNDSMLMEQLPESYGENRDFLPDETSVIVAYCKDNRHLEWILNKHRYNMRAGDDMGSIMLNSELINAKYILLHDGNESTHFINLKKGGPKVHTREQLVEFGYPQYFKTIKKLDGTFTTIQDIEKESKEAHRIYIVFELHHLNKTDLEFENNYWTIADILNGHPARKPFTIKLSEIMNKVKTRRLS